MAAAAIVATACSNDEDMRTKEVDNGRIEVSIEGTINGYIPQDATRAEAQTVVRIQWEGGETVYVYEGARSLGTLTSTKGDETGTYAKLSGTIDAPTVGSTLTLVYSPQFTETPATTDGKITLDLSEQTGEGVPFLIYGTMTATAAGTLTDAVVPFKLATSVFKCGCTGLCTEGEVSQATIGQLNTKCELTLSDSGEPTVGGSTPGNITLTGGIQAQDQRAIFSVAVAATGEADAGRSIVVSKNGQGYGATFPKSELGAAKSYNSVFSLDMHYVSSTSIAILSVNPIYLSMGTQASVEFRVDPSNALVNLSGEDCQIELVKVDTVQARSSSVTTPSNYKLVRIEQVYDGKTEEMKEGQFRAIIEDAKKSTEYDEMAAFVLNVEDVNGEKVQVSSNAFEVKGGFDEKLKTGIPIVFINTPNSNPITSKEDWMACATMTILNVDMTINYQGTLNIKGRGNTTWEWPKKPYALKLDKKEKILGMKKHKRWCLLANWEDKTLMRNAVAFEISRNTELAWTPNGKYVEVVLNGRHVGNYYLCEQIKVDENRVNIAELEPTATDGEGITGGYIFELDTHYDEVYKFRPTRTNFPWMFKDPDEVNEAQLNWAQNFVNGMEDALYDATKFANREFVEYMNLESYVDWWFVNELSMNDEIRHPKSCYMYKDANGKMTAGPVWDFDWGTFTPEATSSFRGKNGLYYPRLFADPTFVAMVKTRWETFKPAFETNIPAFIDATKSMIGKSAELNAPLWPIRGGVKPNGDESLNFEDAVARLKAAYLDKLEWLDTQIQSW